MHGPGGHGARFIVAAMLIAVVGALTVLMLRSCEVLYEPPSRLAQEVSGTPPPSETVLIDDAPSVAREDVGSEEHRAEPLPFSIEECIGEEEPAKVRACIRAQVESASVSPEDLISQICVSMPQDFSESAAEVVLQEFLRASDPGDTMELLSVMAGSCDLFNRAEAFSSALLSLRDLDPRWFSSFVTSIDGEQVVGRDRPEILAATLTLLLEVGGESGVLNVLEAAGRGEFGADYRQSALCLRSAAKGQADAESALAYLDSVIGSTEFDTDDPVAGTIAMTLLEPGRWPGGDARPALERVLVCLTDNRFRLGAAAQLTHTHGPTAPEGIDQEAWNEVWDLALSVASERGLKTDY